MSRTHRPMKTALLAIDLQNDFVSESGILGKHNLAAQNPELLPSISSLVSRFRAKSEPVVWIRSEYTETPPKHSQDYKPTARPPGPRYVDAPMSSDRLIGTHVGSRAFCRPGSPGADFPSDVKELKQDSDVVVTKTFFSAFTDTNLQQILQEQNIEAVVLAGITANTCVLATTTDAFFLQYDVTVVETCVAAFSSEMKTNALNKIREHYGRVLSSIEELETSRGVGNKLIRPTDAGVRTLYYVNGSIPSWRVMIAFAEKGISYDRVRLRVMSHPRETRCARFSKLNPRCKTPTLVDSDGTVVIESMAILQYLESVFAEASGVKGLVPDPKTDKAGYANVISRFQESENIHYVFDDIELFFLDDATTDPVKRNKIIEAYDNTLNELVFWEGYVTESKFVAGDEFTIADCAFYPCIAYLERRGFEYDGFPKLKEYVERMKTRHSVQDALPFGWHRVGKVNLWAKSKRLVEKEDGGIEA